MKTTNKTKIQEFINEFNIHGANIDNCILYTTFTSKRLIEIIDETWIHLHYSYTDPFFRNAGNSRMLLYNILNEHPDKKFYCFVKKTNIASIKCLEHFKAEISEFDEEFLRYDNIRCYVTHYISMPIESICQFCHKKKFVKKDDETCMYLCLTCKRNRQNVL